MIRVHLLPEMAPGKTPLPCAQIRLLRPYQHPSVQGQFNLSVGERLPGGRLDVVVTQRGGPVDCTLDDVIALVREIRQRGAKLVYDLDDDLLAPHPVLSMEMGLRPLRPRIRFMLREADLVTVSTAVLSERLAVIAPRRAVVPNGLDETLIPPLPPEPGAAIGYFGSITHIGDLMAVISGIERSAYRAAGPLRLELQGISTDPRLRRLSGGNLKVGYLPEVDNYGQFHAALAKAGWRIGLAPLEPGGFNDAKSDIKVLDYAAANIAVLAADNPVYADWNTDCIARAPHDAFDAALDRLLADEPYRAALARNARDHLMQTRTLAQIAPLLPAVIETAFG